MALSDNGDDDDIIQCQTKHSTTVYIVNEFILKTFLA